jgi:hypothetical protein
MSRLKLLGGLLSLASSVVSNNVSINVSINREALEARNPPSVSEALPPVVEVANKVQ